MEDLALERLAQILAWMRPHERDVVLSAYLGRYRSPGEYVRRELADGIVGPFWWLAEYIDYEAIAATWFAGGRITVLEDSGDDEVTRGVFVLRGSW